MALPERLAPNVNGRTFSWINSRFQMLNRLIRGIEKFEYDEPQEKELIHGADTYAVGFGEGQIVPTFSISLHFEEVAALIKIAPGGKLQNIPPFDFTATFHRDTETVTCIVRNCQFKNTPIAMAKGDKNRVYDFDILCTHADISVS